MLSSSLDALLKVSKKSSPRKLFDYDCVTLFKENIFPTYLQSCYFAIKILKQKGRGG